MVQTPDLHTFLHISGCLSLILPFYLSVWCKSNFLDSLFHGALKGNLSLCESWAERQGHFTHYSMHSSHSRSSQCHVTNRILYYAFFFFLPWTLILFCNKTTLTKVTFCLRDSLFAGIELIIEKLKENIFKTHVSLDSGMHLLPHQTFWMHFF